VDPVAGDRWFIGAKLQCEKPPAINWSLPTLDPFDPEKPPLAKPVVIHVYSPFIVPGGTYEVRVLDPSCPQVYVWNEDVSPPLVMTTSPYGDISASLPKNNYDEWGPADGTANMASDCLALKEKYGNKWGLIKPRAELGGPRDNPNVDMAINYTMDNLYCKEAFGARPFPFPAPADEAWPCVEGLPPPWGGAAVSRR
jgi:hypothetical protein